MLGECWLILRTSHWTRRKLLQAVRLSALPHLQPDYVSAQVRTVTLLAICVSDSVLCLIPSLTILSAQVYTVTYPGNLCFSLLS